MHFHGKQDEWPEEELWILKDAWRGCETRDQISVKIGRSKSAISKKIKQLGLTPRRSKLEINKEIKEQYDAGIPASIIGEKFGVSKTTILKLVKDRCRSGPELTDNEKDIIEDRCAEGCSAACIATRIRRRTGVVNKYINDMGLKEDEQDFDVLVRELLDADLSVDQVATKLELPRRSIIYAMKRIKKGSASHGV